MLAQVLLLALVMCVQTPERCIIYEGPRFTLVQVCDFNATQYKPEEWTSRPFRYENTTYRVRIVTKCETA